MKKKDKDRLSCFRAACKSDVVRGFNNAGTQTQGPGMTQPSTSEYMTPGTNNASTQTQAPGTANAGTQTEDSATEYTEESVTEYTEETLASDETLETVTPSYSSMGMPLVYLPSRPESGMSSLTMSPIPVSRPPGPDPTRFRPIISGTSTPTTQQPINDPASVTPSTQQPTYPISTSPKPLPAPSPGMMTANTSTPPPFSTSGSSLDGSFYSAVQPSSPVPNPPPQTNGTRFTAPISESPVIADAGTPVWNLTNAAQPVNSTSSSLSSTIYPNMPQAPTGTPIPQAPTDPLIPQAPTYPPYQRTPTNVPMNIANTPSPVPAPAPAPAQRPQIIYPTRQPANSSFASSTPPNSSSASANGSYTVRPSNNPWPFVNNQSPAPAPARTPPASAQSPQPYPNNALVPVQNSNMSRAGSMSVAGNSALIQRPKPLRPPPSVSSMIYEPGKRPRPATPGTNELIYYNSRPANYNRPSPIIPNSVAGSMPSYDSTAENRQDSLAIENATPTLFNPVIF